MTQKILLRKIIPELYKKFRLGAKIRNIEKFLNIDDVVRSDRAFLW